MPAITSNPDSTLAVILSLIPFFTPILMTVRIAATDVPAWQIIASVVLTIGTFFGLLWIASKIYRVGILMYGKKPKLKDLIKWIKLAK
jgi:ABC-2 type transport system permease protein